LAERVFAGRAPDAAAEERAKAAFDAMNAKQRMGQLVMAPWIKGVPAAGVVKAVRSGAIGGVLLLGKGWSGAKTVKAATRKLAKVPRPAGVGMFVAADQEGGSVQRLKGAGFSRMPPALTQGEWSIKKELSRFRTWGTQLAKVGVNLDFAPVADVVPESIQEAGTNQPIGVLKRSFGSDPSDVGAHAAAAVAGLREAGVGSGVKHFPGLGRVRGNTDLTDQGTRDRVTSGTVRDMEAFRIALQACPSTVMVSLATYTKIDPSGPAAFSSAVIADLLRGEFGWTGVVASDALDAAAARAVAAEERAVRFVEAGGDLAVFSSVSATKAALAGLREAYGSDPKFRAVADSAVMRVLTLKAAQGLV
jgi:beta-N-acetylhexosaminidase